MKNLLILILITAAAYSVNAKGIQITNNTNCTVYYTLRGDVTSMCSHNTYSSGVLSIAGLGTIQIYNDPTLVPGGMQNSSSNFLTTSDYINHIQIYNADPSGSCTIYNVDLSNCNTLVNHFTYNPSTCSDDCTLTITWTAGMVANVTIN